MMFEFEKGSNYIQPSNDDRVTGCVANVFRNEARIRPTVIAHNYPFVLYTLACFRIGTWQVAFADYIHWLQKSTTYPSGTYKDKGQNPIGSSHDTGLAFFGPNFRWIGQIILSLPNHLKAGGLAMFKTFLVLR